MIAQSVFGDLSTKGLIEGLCESRSSFCIDFSWSFSAKSLNDTGKKPCFCRSGANFLAFEFNRFPTFCCFEEALNKLTRRLNS